MRIELPASVTYIANDAFAGDSNLIIIVEAGSYAESWAMMHGDYICESFG